MRSLLHFRTERELEQGTATGDIVQVILPVILLPMFLLSFFPLLIVLILPVILLSVSALSLPTLDGPDPPSDLASSVPALILPTPDGPALSDPAPDGYTHKHGAELRKYQLQVTKHNVGYDV